MGYPEKFANKVLKRFISALLNEHKAIETVQRVDQKSMKSFQKANP